MFLLLAAACGSDRHALDLSHAPRFENATARLGASLVNLRDGVAFLETSDAGRFDLYAADHGRSPVFCRSEIDGTLRCETGAAWGIEAGDLHGVAAADLDGDGDTDLYQAVGGGQGFGKVDSPFDRLYLRQGRRRYVDVGRARLPPDPHGRGRAARVLDYDRDGRLDILVANTRSRVGNSKNRLYHQEKNGRFVDHAPTLGLAFPSTAPLIHDIDGDGYQDVLARRQIYWNDSGAGFTPTRLPADAAAVPHPVYVVADTDNDGRLDILVFVGPGDHRSDLYVVDGAGVLWLDLTAPRDRSDEDRLTFTTRSSDLEIVRLVHRNSTTEELAAGLDHQRVYLGRAKAHPRPYGYDLARSAPVSLGAIETGAPDVTDEGLYIFRSAGNRWTVVAKGNHRARRRGRFVLGLRSPAGFEDIETDGFEPAAPAADRGTAPAVSLRNLGRRQFTSHPLAVRGARLEAGVAFAAAGDFDNDGRVDLVLLSASRGRHDVDDTLLWNAGGNAFVAVPLPTRPGMGEARAAHVWDMDDDGLLDLLLTSDVAGEDIVLGNVSPGVNRWLDLVLRGDGPTARQAAGVRVELVGSWGTQVREVGQATLFNMSVLPLHFGLGAADAAGGIRVFWNSGSADRAADTLTANRRHVLREPDGSSPSSTR